MARLKEVGRTFYAVIPHDSNNLPNGCADSFHVSGDAGTVAIVGEDGIPAVFYANQGDYIPVGGIRVNATNTTATGIVAIHGGS